MVQFTIGAKKTNGADVGAFGCFTAFGTDVPLQTGLGGFVTPRARGLFAFDGGVLFDTRTTIRVFRAQHRVDMFTVVVRVPFLLQLFNGGFFYAVGAVPSGVGNVEPHHVFTAGPLAVDARHVGFGACANNGVPTMEPTMKERFPLEHRRGDEQAYVREYESTRVREYKSARVREKKKNRSVLNG